MIMRACFLEQKLMWSSIQICRIDLSAFRSKSPFIERKELWLCFAENVGGRAMAHGFDQV